MTADHEADRRTREERHREVIAQQLGGDEFPRRCTCSTPSGDPDDHAVTCAVSGRALSSNPTRPAIRRLPEEMF